MTPEKCPGCGTKLSPEMLACPNCPMSFPEDEPSSGSVNPLKQSPYWNFVLPAVFFGALACGIWYIGIGLFHLGEEGAKTYAEKPNFMRSPAEEKKAAEEAAAKAAGGDSSPTTEGAVFQPANPGGGPASPGGSGAAGGEKGGGTAMISITPEDASDSVSSPSAPKAKAVKEWRLRGNVYDLTTFKPVAGVAMVFVDEPTGVRRETRTDSQGRYRVIVPPLDGRGYVVSAIKSGYSPNYLDPATPGVRDLDADGRRSLAKNLASMLTATPASVQAEGAEPLVTDFYLAPRR